MIETILGAIFIIGLFLFTIYGLPKMGYKVRGKRFVHDWGKTESNDWVRYERGNSIITKSKKTLKN